MDRTWAARELTLPGQASLQEDALGLAPQGFPFTHTQPYLQSVLCLECFIPQTTQLIFHLKMHPPLEAVPTHLSSIGINFQILGGEGYHGPHLTLCAPPPLSQEVTGGSGCPWK